MSMLKEPTALHTILEDLPNEDYDNTQHGLKQLRTKVLGYGSASKFSFMNIDNGFDLETSCVTDDSVTISPLCHQIETQELIQHSSCQLSGFALEENKTQWDTLAMDTDFCMHAAFECCNSGIPFASMTPILANCWSKNGDTIKVSEISMQGLVDPIIKFHPDKVLFVPCCEAELIDGQYFSSCGYYMLDSKNIVIKKVIVLIKHCPTTQNGTKNSIAQLVCDYKAIQRMYFMGDMKKDYFQFKYAGLTAAATL